MALFEPKVDTLKIISYNQRYEAPDDEDKKQEQRDQLEKKDIKIYTSCIKDIAEPLHWSGISKTVGEKWYSFSAMQEVICAIYNFIKNASQQVIIREKLGTLRKIGVLSAVGNLYFSQDDTMVIKTALDQLDNDDLTHEQYIALAELNLLRKQIPNFSMVLGRFDCSPPVDVNETPYGYCRGNYKFNYLLYENVRPSMSFRQFILLETPQVILATFYQIALALNVAYQQCRFTHYDLNTGNVLVRLPTRPELNNGFNLPYPHPTKGNILIFAKGVMTFIDYGYSYIQHPVGDGTVKSFGKYGLGQWGVSAEHPFPMHDIYKLMMFSALELSAAVKKEQELKVLERMFRFFSNENFGGAIRRQNEYFYALPNIPEYTKITHADFINYLDQEFKEELKQLVDQKQFSTVDITKHAVDQKQVLASLYPGGFSASEVSAAGSRKFGPAPETLEDAFYQFVDLSKRTYEDLDKKHQVRLTSEIKRFYELSKPLKPPIPLTNARHLHTSAALKAYDTQVTKLVQALDIFWFCVSYLTIGRNMCVRTNSPTEAYDNIDSNFYVNGLSLSQPFYTFLLNQQDKLEPKVRIFLNAFAQFLVQNRINMKPLAPSLFNKNSGLDTPTIVEAKLSWYQPPIGQMVVRVSCIKDGLCATHAFLRATSQDYRALRTVEERMVFARKFRNELADIVNLDYDTLDKKFSLSAVGWTKPVLLAHLRSNCSVGDEALGILADRSNVNIHAIQLLEDGSYEVVDSIAGGGDTHVLILQVSGHYESLLIKSGDQYTVNFKGDSSIIQAIQLRKFGVIKKRVTTGATKPTGEKKEESKSVSQPAPTAGTVINVQPPYIQPFVRSPGRTYLLSQEDLYKMLQQG